MRGTARRAITTPSKRRRRRAGFVLLDALVAFAVLAMGLGTILVGVAIAMHSDARETATRMALRIARSQLAEAGTTYPLTPGRIAGEEPGGERWIVDVSLLAPPDTGVAYGRGDTFGKPALYPRLSSYWVDVAVTMREGGEVRLAALKLGPGSTR